jgi:hypothetical protein
VTVWTANGRKATELGDDCTADILAEQLLCALMHDGPDPVGLTSKLVPCESRGGIHIPERSGLYFHQESEQQPTHIAYVIRHRIGIIWPHKNDNGLDLAAHAGGISSTKHILGQQRRHVHVGLAGEDFLFVIKEFIMRHARAGTVGRGVLPMAFSSAVRSPFTIPDEIGGLADGLFSGAIWIGHLGFQQGTVQYRWPHRGMRRLQQPPSQSDQYVDQAGVVIVTPPALGAISSSSLLA